MKQLKSKGVKIFKLTKVIPTNFFQLDKISQGEEIKIMALS